MLRRIFGISWWFWQSNLFWNKCFRKKERCNHVRFDNSLCGCKILQMHYHTLSALSLLVFRIVENLTTKESNNLAAQTYLLIDYVTNSYQEKKIFPTFSLPEEIQGANCSAWILLSKTASELVHTTCFSSPKSDSEMKWRHSSCLQLSPWCCEQKLTTRP